MDTTAQLRAQHSRRAWEVEAGWELSAVLTVQASLLCVYGN